MTPEKVNACMQAFQGNIPDDKMLYLRNTLTQADESCYEMLSSISLKSSTATVLLSVFLGGIGVDRFYIGDVGLGIAKFLFGWITFGIWPLIDIFFSYKKAKIKNLNKIMSNLSLAPQTYYPAQPQVS